MTTIKGYTGVVAALALGMGLALGACDDGGERGVGSAEMGDGGGKQDNAGSGGGFCSERIPSKFEGKSIEGENGWVAGATACASRGSDDEEYLKAVAVLMRSLAIFQDSGGVKANCTPSNAVKQAVDDTYGEFLWYGDNPIFGFHDSGKREVDGLCAPVGESRSRSTVGNQCKTGNDVQKSGLGRAEYDRGAMSLDAAECMALRGDRYYDIIRNHYGEDIEIGCGNSKPARNCGETGEDPDNPDQKTSCEISNDSWNDAKYLGQVKDGWNGDKTEDAELPDVGRAWFEYQGEDVSSFGNIMPHAIVKADADITVCQYIDCWAGSTENEQVTCKSGHLKYLPEGSSARDATAIGCCTSGSNKVDLKFKSVSCPEADDNDESGLVWVSVERSTSAYECIDMSVTVDYGDGL